mmetsp:Transcript_1354/g.3472  ORF Transcript_1354/g.3472 Transcript_1354/m.3472 type:complete len:158 (-) Transcript_1354:325-798(-)
MAAADIVQPWDDDTKADLKTLASTANKESTDPSLRTLSAVASSFRRDDSSDWDGTGSTKGGGDDDDVRKALLRERNREHARLSRQRKRQRLEQLQDENETLSRDCKAARDECSRLRDLLERCDHENARLRSWIDSIISPRNVTGPPPPPPSYSSFRY